MAVADVNEATYPWGRDLQTLTLNNLHRVVVPTFANLQTLIINGTSEQADNTLQLPPEMPVLQNLIIDDTTGNNMLDFIIQTGIRNLEIRNLKCSGVLNSRFYICPRNTPGIIERIDLPATYQPARIEFMRNNYAYSPFAVGAKFILRSPNLIPLSALDNWNNNYSSYVNIYVPDGLVSSYKAASGWSQLQAKIFPISNLG